MQPQDSPLSSLHVVVSSGRKVALIPFAAPLIPGLQPPALSAPLTPIPHFWGDSEGFSTDSPAAVKIANYSLVCCCQLAVNFD